MTSAIAKYVIGSVIGLMLARPAYAQWTEFDWYLQEVGGASTNKAVIMVPVTLDDMTCSMQFDTGAAVSILYRSALPAIYATASDHLKIDRFAVGALNTSKDFRLIYQKGETSPIEKCLQTEVSGTLGNDVFLDGSVTLDLKNARFRWQHGSYQASLDSAAAIIPFELGMAFDGAVVWLDADVGQGAPVKLLFDTGSAALDLIIPRRKDWLALVKLDDEKEAKSSIIQSWQQDTVCYYAPLQQKVKIGPVEFGKETNATFCTRNGVEQFADRSEFGVIGLAPFQNKAVTIDYVAHRLYVEAPEPFKASDGARR